MISLINIKEIVKGGFGTIYYVKWGDGRIDEWDIKNQQWKRFSRREMVLKFFDGIEDINDDFLNEMAIHLKTIETRSILFMELRNSQIFDDFRR
ncbi:hypothetical protein Glove_276g57 [Diversispora epigaea]|uniref:Protein kinase domain-containing protein n=1 Tax=Diversispora epigaea TaxID=1348612 RepID=A0A397I2X8_9GLOM|nr:hypothetical protein Glove_276g57 [Diversispora epigaea]